MVAQKYFASRPSVPASSPASRVRKESTSSAIGDQTPKDMQEQYGNITQSTVGSRKPGDVEGVEIRFVPAVWQMEMRHCNLDLLKLAR